MDEIGLGVSSWVLEACRMSNEAPTNDEVATRVRAAVAGDFKAEHVNGFPMRPDVGSIDLGLINVRSSRPPVKEDEVDRDKRRESAEKQKQRGEPEEESHDEDEGDDGDDSDDSEGMASRLDRILEGPPRADADAPRTGAPKEGPGGSFERQQRELSPRRSRADIPPAPAQSQSVPRPQPPPAPKAGDRAKPQATGPLTRGRAAASGKGETSRRSSSLGARQAGDAELRPAPAREGPGALTRGGSRPAGRGTGRRAVLPVGLKRTLEQAQPSLAKRLKVGAASNGSRSSDPRSLTGAENAPPRTLVGESAPSSPKQDARPMDEEAQISLTAKRMPWPAGLRSVEEQRKKEEEEREQETRRQP
ncbi:uncharacterized protein LOC110433692 [Sorghum bicolor]|uniref:uncharacterized protein LOC110433692 n=1 Tax=Sorghum bicolor TaxID=4558 RepID=UPI000B423BE3|nr:uncharacterized protein LOC110433692 [Sorghum bicolor]|eukprot:XP_021311880.1 uncharacterized protein LOC110433692 [Sorghum bicolor]